MLIFNFLKQEVKNNVEEHMKWYINSFTQVAQR